MQDKSVAVNTLFGFAGRLRIRSLPILRAFYPTLLPEGNFTIHSRMTKRDTVFLPRPRGHYQLFRLRTRRDFSLHASQVKSLFQPIETSTTLANLSLKKRASSLVPLPLLAVELELRPGRFLLSAFAPFPNRNFALKFCVS
jgi:hypothetical protein